MKHTARVHPAVNGGTIGQAAKTSQQRRGRVVLGEKRASAASQEAHPGGWTFLSNHTHVLVCLAGNPDLTLREVATRVGITERAVQRIVADLGTAGVLTKKRDGRRNRYALDTSVRLRHPLEQHCRVGELIGLVLSPGAPS